MDEDGLEARRHLHVGVERPLEPPPLHAPLQRVLAQAGRLVVVVGRGSLHSSTLTRPPAWRNHTRPSEAGGESTRTRPQGRRGSGWSGYKAGTCIIASTPLHSACSHRSSCYGSRQLFPDVPGCEVSRWLNEPLSRSATYTSSTAEAPATPSRPWTAWGSSCSRAR